MKKNICYSCSVIHQMRLRECDYSNFNFTGSNEQKQKFIKHNSLPISDEPLTTLLNPTYDNYKYLNEITIAFGSIEQVYRGGGNLTAINYILPFNIPIGNLFISQSLNTTQDIRSFKVVNMLHFEPHGFSTGSFAVGAICDKCNKPMKNFPVMEYLSTNYPNQPL